MRTLVINSMFANALYRRCADELGTLPGVDLTMLTVDGWRMNGRPMPFDDLQPGSPYRTVVGKASWKGYENRGFYRTGILEAFRQSRPEAIFLMEEPFSVFAFESLTARALLAPRAPVVFFTWNNLSLEQFDYRPSIFYRTVARMNLPQMQYALTANKAGVDVLRDAGFTRPVKVVGYGVDTAAYSTPRSVSANELRRQLQIASDETVIAYVGRLIAMKGVDLLIEAFAQLKRTMPQKRLKLLLLGGGDEQQQLIARARSLGLGDSLRHVPVVPQQQVPDYMHALDILVLPSRRVGMWAEQFGRVLVEAMAAGKIVVGSSSGAIPEVIGDAGFVFLENDRDDLQRQLEYVLSLSEAERALLQQRAVLRATRDYSWGRFARDAYEALEHCYRQRAGK